ncbi:bifunctional diaminohydroxyphosphoribosylaminopyrimidine deaminase/5-amino-6-(5-phosphoribosylamino)uracil reductase RibD [Lysinibacillus telephonicus]|uniref:bifunctional diaminohydroxyphosphoribosylaminopyrimidine deaminase/5-amino-6-(5-phosphoribosylamino)uracil reductase RibD n=1 Tax=Lysinibacillus telephonicus TaxID=1714840 RepID=UPI003B9DCF51
MKTDREYMQLALDLAASAKGNTNPNPVVGAVLVKDGLIVGTGLHRKAGEPHAEVHAFNMAGEHAKGATLYVTLEPCSHFGKTPPCANLVKESEVSRVVVATMDPNPSVAGRGIRLLQEAGIQVEVGVLEEEARKLNERFIHNMLTSRPFVISKFAMTLDGKIATHTGHSKWITSEEARLQVHELRNEVDAILVGIGTVLADNPSLTTRLPDREGKNPIRVILDSELKTPLDANIVNTIDASTIIVCGPNVEAAKVSQLQEKGVKVISVTKNDHGLDLEEMLNELYKNGITDVLVEGGAEVNASFLRAGLINKFLAYVSPKILGGRKSKTPFTGIEVDTIDEALQLEIDSVEKIGPDLCITAYPKLGKTK